MKVGRLFEDALKEAQIELKPGAEMRVRVQGEGKNLHLVVRPSRLSEFEASVLKRSQKASEEDLTPYNPKMSVGERIRTIRKAGGFTLEALATKAGMSKGSLCSIEKGERSAGLAILKKISKALEVSVTVFVE